MAGGLIFQDFFLIPVFCSIDTHAPNANPYPTLTTFLTLLSVTALMPVLAPQSDMGTLMHQRLNVSQPLPK